MDYLYVCEYNSSICVIIMIKCKAMTVRNVRCRRNVITGFDFCILHLPEIKHDKELMKNEFKRIG
jgi:hypothetical protein